MPTVFFYLLACIPFVIGGICWALDKRINWIEWLINTAICFAMAGIFHVAAISGQTLDIETWSGQLIDAKHYAAWQEYYEEAIYRTEYYNTMESYSYSVGSGKNRSTRMGTRTVRRSRQVFDHWESRTRWHKDSWVTNSNISTSYNIDSNKFENLCVKFTNKDTIRGDRTTGAHNSRMIGGDPNDYETHNHTGWVEPVTKLVEFENKIRATPTTFSFAKVPENIKVYDYPKNDNPFVSDRLIGTALATIDLFVFDQMNARLGPVKRVNVVMVGMGDRDSMSGEWQRASWIGGKKNDVIITWGGNNKSPQWVKVFGWTDSDVCKRNIESIILDNGAQTSTLKLIEDEIKVNYKLKDWDKAFSHISVPAPDWALWWYLGVMVFSQAGLWFLFTHNEFNKK